jgi:carboxyl-terminal processing protease
MSKSSKILLLAVSVVLVLTLFLGANSSRVSAASGPQDGAYRQMQVYSEVLRHIQTDYVEDPNMNSVTSGALRGLLESLDSNSSYLSPAEYKEYKSHDAGRAQVGINIAKRFGFATVISVIPGSAADRANINDGDVIESIDDKNTRDLSLATIELLLEGQPGTSLNLAVIHPPKATPEKVALLRGVRVLPPASEALYEGSTILYLKPVILDKEHVQQLESKLKGMNKNSKKVLLDLRDVSSGDNAEALRLANFFIKSGTLALLEGQKVAKQTFTADPSKAINATAPLVVLVNRGTAGPAELVAGAIADSKRGELVGEKTFGDGSQQKTFEMADGAALILSIAKYETPSGKKLQDEGITPGVLVASAQDDAAADDDGSDDAAPAPSTPAATKPAQNVKPPVKVDDQLSKALDILKAKNV